MILRCVRSTGSARDRRSRHRARCRRGSQAKPVSPAAKPVSLAVQVAPNPFNPTTTLHLGLPVGGRVVLTLYNMAGQPVRTLLNTTMEAGYYTVLWNGRDEQGQPVSSGVYLYRVQTQEQVLGGKIALIR